MPTRVLDLAKEFGLSNKELLARLADLKISVKTHASVLSEEDEAKIRESLDLETKQRAGQLEDAEAAELAKRQAEEQAAREEAQRAAEEAAQEDARQAAHRALVIRLACVGAFSALVIALAVVLIRKLHKAGKC